MELQIHDGQAEKVAFRSPRRMLVRFFRTSRDRWKQKYKTLKESFRKQVWQIRDLTRSREQWRREAEALQLPIGSSLHQPVLLGVEVDAGEIDFDGSLDAVFGA